MSSTHRLLAVHLVLLGLLSVPADASYLLGSALELEARYWTSDFTGSAFVDGVPAEINPQVLLDMDVDESLEGRLTVRPGAGIFLRARYQTLSSAGTQDLDFNFELPGGDIPVAVGLSSFLEFDYGGVALGWQFRNAPGKWRIGPFVEAKGVRGSTGIDVSLLGQTEGVTTDFEGGILSYGALVEVMPSSRLQLFAEMSVSAEDDVDLNDMEIGLRFFPTPRVGLGLGYRVLEIEGTVDDVPLSLEYEGAFGSLLLTY